MIEIDTRLRAARGLEKPETEASQAAFQHLKARGKAHTPPPVSSDGWGGIDQALIAGYGQVPPYQGRGRPPSKKQAGEDWQYLQVIKHRDTHGSRQAVELTVVLGDEAEVLAALGRSTA